MNLSGKPARIGGTLAGALGVIVLLAGLSTAVALGGLVAWLATWGLALAVGGPIAAVTAVVAWFLITSGRKMQRSGADAERATFDRALVALAQERGAISAGDASAALGLDRARADDLLTALAKREPERIAVEVDDQGVVWFRSTMGRPRVDAFAVPPHTRVASPEPARDATARDAMGGGRARGAAASDASDDDAIASEDHDATATEDHGVRGRR